MDEAPIGRQLDACALTPRGSRLGMAGWVGLDDPSPAWQASEPADEAVA
jgi:hypothetical protein